MCLWASFCCTDEGTQTWPVWMTWPMSHCWQNSDSIPAAWAWSVYSTIRYCKHLGITICWTTSVTHQHLNRVPILLSQYPVWTYQKWYSLVVNGLCLGFNKPPLAVRLKEHSTVFWTHPGKTCLWSFCTEPSSGLPPPRIWVTVQCYFFRVFTWQPVILKQPPPSLPYPHPASLFSTTFITDRG